MASSTCITRDPMSGDYSSKGTWSFWIKICDPDLSNNGGIFMLRKGNSYTASRLRIYLESGSNKLVWELKDSGGSDDSFIKSNARLRDVGAWYHICMSYDSTLGTAADRLKMWINGKDVRTEYGGFQSDDQVGSNFQYLASSAMFVALGRVDENNGLDYKFDGSMAECYFIYNSTYDVSTFGETDATTGEWKPKLDIASGITFGSQGFYFPFTNAADMKADGSGNSNTYTITGTLTQSKDCPSNDFTTLNTLERLGSNITVSNGNTQFFNQSSDWRTIISNLAFPNTGKFYAEMQVNEVSSAVQVGIMAQLSFVGNYQADLGTQGQYNSYAYLNTGQKRTNSSTTSYGNSFTSGVIGIAVDMDNKNIYFSKDGVWQNSGNPESGATGTGAAFTDLQNDKDYCFAVASQGSNPKVSWNFGNGTFGTTAVTSAGTTGSTPGTFEYDVPSGYEPLSTKGLNA